MQPYETSATVTAQGLIQIDGVPFAAGTEVEVSISPKRRPVEEFAATWRQVCAELRSLPALQGLTDDEIRTEIDRYQAGQ